MQLNNLRHKARRLSGSRRRADRRSCPYSFDSFEWIDFVRSSYVVWPKCDRREADRRSIERREQDRRQQQLSEQIRSSRKYSPILLSQEELKLIESLYQCDIN